MFGTVVPPPPLVMLLYFLVLTAEWTGPVVAPPTLLILLYSLVLTAEWRVSSYGVCYCCAPFLPLAAVFSRVDGGGEGYGPTDSGIVVPLPSPCYGIISRFDAGGERMVLRGLVLLCPSLPPS